MEVLKRPVTAPMAGPAPAPAMVTTYRYLRLSMIALVVGLGACVLYEHAKTAGGCWQTSISAYYYTPVQAFFVGALVVIGVSLVALRGNTSAENLLLDLAGICAPVVALVPTPLTGSCGSALTDTRNRLVNVENNMLGVLVAGGLGLVIVGVVALRNTRSHRPDRPDSLGVAAFWIITVLFLGTVAVYVWDRTLLLDRGHDVAAIAMFALILGNVVLNAVHLREVDEDDAAEDGADKHVRPWPLNRYGIIAQLMVVAVIANVIAWSAGFAWWVLTLEASMIILFAWFWVAQTIELWTPGLRSEKVRLRAAART